MSDFEMLLKTLTVFNLATPNIDSLPSIPYMQKSLLRRYGQRSRQFCERCWETVFVVCIFLYTRYISFILLVEVLSAIKCYLIKLCYKERTLYGNRAYCKIKKVFLFFVRCKFSS